MTRTDDLIVFLTARLDEDEAKAREFDGVDPLCYEHAPEGLSTSPEYVTLYLSPRRALDEVDAKRRIISEFLRCSPATVVGLLFAVQVLSLPYADHPDYQESWRP